MGPMGEHKKKEHCSVNVFQRTHDINLDSCLLNEKIANGKIGQAESKLETATRSKSIGSRMQKAPIAKLEQPAVVNLPLTKEEQVEYDIDNATLRRQLERPWKTDFGDSVVGTRVSPSVEDKMAVKKNGRIFAKSWQSFQLLKKRLLKDEDLLAKYRTTMEEYIVKGYA